ncbi:hypothetical protein [Polluticaenibacter yanchengensis]|uniref:HTTM domain-containing protein n=1 Tax=Polluticaenibacter yanchengensis TaxID=3014562 RepID=A0ABT4UJ62_9BACT|nr:hypothetical protein [Chitinophagaceae bacterium LY-5]
MSNLPFFSINVQSRLINQVIILFYCLAAYKLLAGMWLFQLEPFEFLVKKDVTGWWFLQTGLHTWLLDNRIGCVLMDSLFYSFPLIVWLVYKGRKKQVWVVSLAWLVVNWLYVQAYVQFPTNSIEGHIAWLFLPLLFAFANHSERFYYVMHALRYYFLFFFATAAIWKIRQGGLFNTEQMSAVLLAQHKAFLVAWPQHWFTAFIYFLVQHQWLSYGLYLVATLLELVFLAGFFTEKYDRILFGLFVLFLIFDFIIMRIPYFEVLPLAVILLFSKYQLQEQH